MKDLINKIHLADCLEVMRSIPDKSIDLVLTDPPYGINFGKYRKAIPTIKKQGETSKREIVDKYVYADWDSKIPEEIYFKQLIRISKNQIIFGINYFNYKCLNSVGRIVWDKLVPVPTLSKCEILYCSFFNKVEYIKYKWAGMHQGIDIGTDEIQQDKNKNETRVHSTQKPLKLIEYIIKNYSKENDLIFDGFAGSGTTALACIELNRRFICVEKDVDYFNIASKRIDDAKSQLTLF